MFKMLISSDKWEPCGTVDSVELSPTTDSCFPRSWKPEGKKLTLNNMLSSFPTLDVYNDNIVYMAAKMNNADPSGWVLAVNSENKKMEKISSFFEERFHFFRIFRQSDFSKHIREGRGNLIYTVSSFHHHAQKYVNARVYLWEAYEARNNKKFVFQLNRFEVI